MSSDKDRAEEIVRQNIEQWGWSPPGEMEGLSEWNLAVDACRMGAAIEQEKIIAWLRSGGEYVRGKFYGWDSEMNGYYRSLADRIERGCHHVRIDGAD